MTSIRVGELIIELLKTEEDEDVERILEEMEEIKDPAFVPAVIDAYIKYKSSTISHYFIAFLSKYSLPEVKSFLTTLALDPSLREADFPWVLDYLPTVDFQHPSITNRAISLFANSENLSYWELSNIVKYLKLAKALEPTYPLILEIIYKQKIERETRRTAIRILLDNDPAKTIQHFIDNFEKVFNSKSDALIVQALTGWVGVQVETFRNLVLEKGNDFARELIKEQREKTKKIEVRKEEQQATLISTEYSNSDIVRQIYELRKKINILTLSESSFGFALFPESTLLVFEMKNVNSASDLLNTAINIRAFSHLFSDQIELHGLDFETAAQHIPNTTEEDMNTPLNRLHLFMISRSKQVTKDVYGLRLLNAFPNKSAHPDDLEGLVMALTKLGLLELYKKSEWTKIQRALLEMLRDSLRNIELSLT